MTGLCDGDGERAHAERCARTIADYWLARGERVTVKAVGLSKINSAGGRVTAIRSDLRAGLPTRTSVVFTPAERRGPR